MQCYVTSGLDTVCPVCVRHRSVRGCACIHVQGCSCSQGPAAAADAPDARGPVPVAVRKQEDVSGTSGVDAVVAAPSTGPVPGSLPCVTVGDGLVAVNDRRIQLRRACQSLSRAVRWRTS